mgnify:CR=1 FL=1
MAKIARYPGNLKAFASEALGTERTVFGDTAQSDLLADNITTDFLRGWGIVGVNENPTKQDFNGMAFTLGQLLAYLHQMGIAEWNDEQEYPEHGICAVSGTLYRSLSDGNIGNDPTTDDVNWKYLLSADDVTYNGSDVKTALDGLTGGFTIKAVGETFNLSTHLAGVTEPDNSGSAKFVKLTAGLDGAGQFNEGLLINETITGSGPTIEVTAEIATGPLAGNVINLLNSENRYLMPGENSGAVADDQMQQITGEWARDSIVGPILSNAPLEGAFKRGNATYANAMAGASASGYSMGFDSALSPNARTGDHTNVKHAQATYYLRIA